MQTGELDPRLGIGGNNPPEVTLVDRLKEDHADLAKRIDEIAERANNAPKEVGDEDDAKLVGEIAALAAAELANAENTRKREKEPILKAQRDLDGFFKVHTDRLARIKTALLSRVDAFRDRQEAEARRMREAAEKDARDRAEAAKAAAEEAMKAGRVEDAMDELKLATAAETLVDEAASKAPERSEPIRTDSGATLSGRKEWDFEIIDYEAIPLSALRPYLDRASVEKAIRAMLKIKKGDAAIQGVRFFERTKTQVRRT